jgi:hypothetical protein
MRPVRGFTLGAGPSSLIHRGVTPQALKEWDPPPHAHDRRTLNHLED